jgi:RNA polymerase sigma-70 factor, ECF subfamily
LLIEQRAIIAQMPDADDSHANVIRELRAGRNVDENFRRLFQNYFPAVSAYFARHGFSADESRDMAQDVFLAVYSGLESLRSEDAFIGWLFSIARHTRFRYLERHKRSPRSVAAGYAGDNVADAEALWDSAAAAEPDPLHRIIEMERIEAVRQALSELPGRVQDCLRARVVDGLKYSEIGKRLGISENTVAVHVHRGLKSLKARVKTFFGGTLFHGEV